MPDDLLYDGNGYEVNFYADKDGKPDISRVLNSAKIDGRPGDLEEIADTYATRLANGVKPRDMFKDIEEANIRSMRKISTEMKRKTPC